MKKTTIFTLLTIFVLTLTACNGASSAPPTDSGSPVGVSSAASSADIATPVTIAATAQPPSMLDETQLIIGTFKLEGTDQAITAQQAAALLPLWQALKDAQSSAMQAGKPQAGATPQDNTALQQQIDSQVKQIEAGMTAAQLEAIQNTNLTEQDMLSTLQELGITMDASRPGNGSDQSNGTFTPPQGTPPAGNMPGDNGAGGGAGQAPQPDEMGTPRAGMAPGNGLVGFVPTELIDAFIQFLQKKAAS